MFLLAVLLGAFLYWPKDDTTDSDIGADESATDVLNYVASIFARGDAKES